MSRIGPLVALIVFLSVPVCAQDDPRRPSLAGPLTVFAGAAAADWATTYYVLHQGGHEQNPLLSPAHSQPLPTVALGVAIDVVGAWVWVHYVGRSHPRLAAMGLYVMAGFRAGLAVHNAGEVR